MLAVLADLAADYVGGAAADARYMARKKHDLPSCATIAASLPKTEQSVAFFIVKKKSERRNAFSTPRKRATGGAKRER